MPREDELLEEEQEFLQEVVERVADHLEYAKLEIFRRLHIYVTDKEEHWLKRFCKKNKLWFEPADDEESIKDDDLDDDLDEEDPVKGKQYFDEELSCLLKYWKEEFLLRFKSHQQLEQEKNTKSQFTSDQIKQILNGTDNALRYTSNMKQSLMEKEDTVAKQSKELQILNGMLDRRSSLLDMQRKEHFRELFFLKEQIAQYDIQQKNTKEVFNGEVKTKRSNEGPLGHLQSDLLKVKDELANKHNDLNSLLMKLTGVQLKIHEQSFQTKLESNQIQLLTSEAKEIKDMVSLALTTDGYGHTGISVQDLLDENVELRAKVSELDKDIFSLKNMMNVEKELRPEEESSRKEHVSVERVIEELKLQPAVPEKKKRTLRESKETQQKFATLIAKIESMKLQLTVKDGEIRQMKNETTSLYGKINALKAKLVESIEEKHHTKLNEEKEKMDIHEMQMKQHRIQMINEDLRVRLFEYVGKLKTSSNTMLKLNALKNTYRNEAITAERDVRNFQNEMQELQSKYNDSVQKANTLTDDAKVSKAKITMLEDQNQVLVEQQRKLKKGIETLKQSGVEIEPTSAVSSNFSEGHFDENFTPTITPRDHNEEVEVKQTVGQPETVCEQNEPEKEDDQRSIGTLSSRSQSSVNETEAYTSQLELIDQDFALELGAALKFTAENPIVIPNIAQFKDKHVESRYPTYEYEEEEHDDIKSVFSDIVDSFHEDGVVLTESKVSNKSIELQTPKTSPPLQKINRRESLETRIRVRARAGSIIEHDIRNEFLLVSDTFKEYAKMQSDDIMEIDEERLNEEIYSKSKEIYNNKMEVVERLEARSKLMFERVSLKKKIIEQTRREKLEKVLTSSMLMSQGHPAEVKSLRTGFIKELREELDAIKKRQEQKRQAFVPIYSAYQHQFDEEMLDLVDKEESRIDLIDKRPITRASSPQPGKQKRHFTVKTREFDKKRPHTALGTSETDNEPLKVTSFKNEIPNTPSFLFGSPLTGPMALNRSQLRSSRERPKTAVIPPQNRIERLATPQTRPTVQEQIEYIQPHYLIRPSSTTPITTLLPTHSPNITISGRSAITMKSTPPTQVQPLVRAQSCPPPESKKPSKSFQPLISQFSSPLLINDSESESDEEEGDGEKWDIAKIERYAEEMGITEKTEKPAPKTNRSNSATGKKQLRVLLPSNPVPQTQASPNGLKPW
jgi:hypothetical protein